MLSPPFAGTSPAPIGRVFEFSGVETKYLPISDLADLHDFRRLLSSSGFLQYEKFLEKQGISKKKIEESPKTFVFYDFTHTGNSLKIFKELMIEHLQLPEDKVDFRSLNKDIYDSWNNEKKSSYLVNSNDSELFANLYIDQYLYDSEASVFGGISHLSYVYLRGIDECGKYSNEIAKRYNMCVMHKLAQMGLLQYNPNNKESL